MHDGKLISIMQIAAENAVTFKTVRLQALQDAPTAFCSTYAQASQISDDEWTNRAAQCATETSPGYLAMDGNEACGIARATPDDRDPSTAWLESMWVAPSHRRLGVGTLLVAQIAAWASRRGIHTLKLSVTSNNESAISFYRRLGFSPTGNSEPYRNDPTLFELEMEKPLS